MLEGQYYSRKESIMSEQNPNEEQIPNEESELLEDALPTQMMPEDMNLGGANELTAELQVISFYLPSRSEPLISRETMITIGRRDPKRKINPTIDLTEERGAQLGVSRLHVEINFQNGRYYLKDMGSANGTWVNNSKLVPYQPHPIETGDQIRLGQLALLIHITMPQQPAATSSQRIVDIITEGNYTIRVLSASDNEPLKSEGGFTPALLDKLTEVMQTVERIYFIVRNAQQQDIEGLTIARIRTSPKDSGILLDINGGADVITFLVSNMPEFVKTLQGGDAVKMSEAMEKALQVANVDKYETIPEQVAEYALQELVFKFLDENRKTYVQQLVPYLATLIDSSLKIVSSE